MRPRRVPLCSLPRGYVAQAAAALAAGRADYLAQLRALPARVDPLLAAAAGTMQRLGRDPAIQRFVFLGSGANYGLACEAMLKMKELALAPSEAFHFLEFRHGPKAVVGDDMLVVGLPSDTARAEEATVLAEVRRLGAHVLVVAESAADLPADEQVELGCGLDERARLPLLLPCLQLLAYERAISRGLDPDRPAHLSHVVRL